MKPICLFVMTTVLFLTVEFSFANEKDSTSHRQLRDILILAKAAASEADTAAKEAAVAAQKASEAVQAIVKQSSQSYWGHLDLSLDPSLAATLAGLALAAATFLFSAEAVIRLGTPNGMEAKIKNAIAARKYLVLSFYGFLVALASGITIDPGQVLGEAWSLPSLCELGFSGGGTVFGAFFLFKGARTIMKLEEPMK